MLRDQALKLARERIRLNMGVLKALGEHWPLGKRTYREVGVIAREILCLVDQDILPLAGPPSATCSFESISPSTFDYDSAIDLIDFLDFENMES